MPTVFRQGPYRFFFYSNEGSEPIHIHVEAGDCAAKFWLGPICLASAFGFKSHELAEIESIINVNVEKIVEKWNAHFGSADGSKRDV